MAIARRIAYNIVFNSIAKIVSTVMALVAIRFIAQYLGVNGFGEYATVLAFFALFNALADAGISTLAAREISRKDAPEAVIMGHVVAIRLMVSSLVLIIIPIFLPFLPYSQEVKWGILFSAGAFLFSSASGVLNGIFQKRLIMYKVAMVEFVGKCLQLGLIWIVVSLDWGFLAIVFSLLAYMIFNAVLIFFLSRSYVSFRFSYEKDFWKAFLRESMPIGIISIVTFSYFKMDTILLSVFRSSEDVGLYNIAYKIIENLTFFPAMIAGLVLPIFSRFIFSEPEKFRLVADKTFKVFVMFATPLAIGGFLLADQLVTLIGGPDFLTSAQPLRFLVFALAAIFLGNFFNALLIAGNVQKKLLFVLCIVALFNIVANIILIPLYSFMGAAITSLVTEAVVALSSAVLAYRFLAYQPSFEGVFGIIFSALGMGMFLFFFSQLSFPVLVLAGILVYVFFLWITGSVRWNEVVLLLQSKGNKDVDISMT